ncbi:MAG: hypothetical protein ABMA14_18825, partial [Hyphomonadaceae bacterium]
MKKYLRIYAVLVSVFLILLAGYLAWEVWKYVSGVAVSPENLSWYARTAGAIFVVSAVIAAGS